MTKKRKNKARSRESHSELWDESEAQHLHLPTIDGIPPGNSWYSTRAADDMVVSGPLVPYKSHGRTFKSPSEALAWAQEKYGTWRVSLVEPQPKTRWAILVRKEIKLGRLDQIRKAARGQRDTTKPGPLCEPETPANRSD